LRINYRTSHQIRMQADRLLGPEVADVDGNIDDRRGTVSVFNGPRPDIMVFESREAEIKAVGAWLRARNAEGVEHREIAIFVRSAEQLERARAAALESGLPFNVLDERMGQVKVGSRYHQKS
jgi:superfamily I DNA/RNA helicase